MMYLIGLLPLLLFVTLFVGSGVYFTCMGIANAFYQISPVTAILPAIALACILNGDNASSKMNQFLDGVRHRDIITMCIIFLLAGAFSEVTKNIGSIDATVQCALSFMPPHFLLLGIFIIAAFISTAIGTSMGTIAAIAPIAVGLSDELGISPVIYVATVVSGAMFGDNLSLISDTTIAAVVSQEADSKKKFKLNALIALVASTITLIPLLAQSSAHIALATKPYALILIIPYLLLFGVAMFGINVFIALFLSIGTAGIIGIFVHHDYGFLAFGNSLQRGFASMHEIMVLSLLVGGLSGLAGKQFTEQCAHRLSIWIHKKKAGARVAQLVIAGLASLFDILLANNTIAIIFSGEIARSIAKEHKIPAHYSAAWLDIFASIFQGIIPYGAQVLLASTIAGVSPLSIISHVYYCYALAFVCLVYIILFSTNGLAHE